MFSQMAKKEIEDARAEGRLVRDFNDQEITEDDQRWDRSVYQIVYEDGRLIIRLVILKSNEPGDPEKWEQSPTKSANAESLPEIIISNYLIFL